MLTSSTFPLFHTLSFISFYLFSFPSYTISPFSLFLLPNIVFSFFSSLFLTCFQSSLQLFSILLLIFLLSHFSCHYLFVCFPSYLAFLPFFFSSSSFKIIMAKPTFMELESIFLSILDNQLVMELVQVRVTAMNTRTHSDNV